MVNRIKGSNNQTPLASDVVVGIVGALMGGWALIFFLPPMVEFNFLSFAASIIGSILLLGIVRGLKTPLQGSF